MFTGNSLNSCSNVLSYLEINTMRPSVHNDAKKSIIFSKFESMLILAEENSVLFDQEMRL